MNTQVLKTKGVLFILVSILMVTFGSLNISYAQEGNPTLTASVEAPLTEATLDGSVVTLTLNGRTYARSIFDIRDAVSVSGIDGVTIPWHDPDKISDTQITVELEFNGNFDTDATLTFTVETDAIANYNGPALTAEIPVTGQQESLTASVEAPLTEITLSGSVVTLTLSGASFERSTFRVRDAVSVSGIDGVTVGTFGVDRVSDTEITVELTFNGDFDADAILTFTVGSDAIANYNGPALIAQVSVTAVDDINYGGHIEGPWLWMIAPGGNIHVDNLSAASKGEITEAQIAQNGVSEGEHFGSLQWTSGRLLPTKVCGIFLCSSDNVLNVVREIGLTDKAQLHGYSAYALININSPRAQNNVQMGVGSDDSVKVWLNGSVVHSKQVKRRTTGIQDKFRVNLNAGENLLLVKVGNYSPNPHWAYLFGAVENNDWGMFFEIYLDAEDYTVSLPIGPPNSVSTIVRVHPASVASPGIGNQLDMRLNITGGEAVAGYQATVQFDTTALRYVSGANGDYLPADAFFVKPKVEGNLIKLNATSLEGEVNGDGTLAKLTFEVIAVKPSTLTLSDVLLINSAGEAFEPTVEDAEITEGSERKGDVNGDGIVNIQDLVLVAGRLGQTGTNSADVNGDGIVNIQDLVLVAGALGTSAAAPSQHPQALETLTAADVKQWLSQAQQLDLLQTTSRRGIQFLQQLLVVLTPKENALLPNFPNPFNPETWIPYQLSKPADVTLTIYDIKGHVVRSLDLGHQRAGLYQSRTRAAYWDGRNAVGEAVASGLYFYTLTAGDFTATRKMLIRK